MDFSTFLLRNGITRSASDRQIQRILTSLTFASRFQSYTKTRGITLQDYQDAFDYLKDRKVLDKVANQNKTFRFRLREGAAIRGINIDNILNETTYDDDSTSDPDDSRNEDHLKEEEKETTPDTLFRPEVPGPVPPTKPPTPRPSPNWETNSEDKIWIHSYEEAYRSYKFREGTQDEKEFRNTHFKPEVGNEEYQKQIYRIYTRFDNDHSPINPDYAIPTGARLQEIIDYLKRYRNPKAKPSSEGLRQEIGIHIQRQLDMTDATSATRRSDVIKQIASFHGELTIIERELYLPGQRMPPIHYIWPPNYRY